MPSKLQLLSSRFTLLESINEVSSTPLKEDYQHSFNLHSLAPYTTQKFLKTYSSRLPHHVHFFFLPNFLWPVCWLTSWQISLLFWLIDVSHFLKPPRDSLACFVTHKQAWYSSTRKSHRNKPRWLHLTGIADLIWSMQVPTLLHYYATQNIVLCWM